MLTSFLFNLLEKSIPLREYAYDLIDYEYLEDYVRYFRSLGGIVRSVIYFDYSGDFLDAEGDPDSPYIVDRDGNVHKKEHIEIVRPFKTYLQSLERPEMFKSISKTAKGHL